LVSAHLYKSIQAIVELVVMLVLEHGHTVVLENVQTLIPTNLIAELAETLVLLARNVALAFAQPYKPTETTAEVVDNFAMLDATVVLAFANS